MNGRWATLIVGLVAYEARGVQPPAHLQPAASAPRHAVSVVDLTGRQVDPLDQPGSRAMVFIFTRTDCPVGNRYAPAIQRLRDEFAPKGLTFRLVYVDPAEPVEAVRSHLRQYGYDIMALRDPRHALVELTSARATPEAAVFNSERTLVYRGRIDDRYVDVNRVRSAPTRHDLRDVLTALAEGRPVEPKTTEAIGCFIADLR